MNKKQTYSGSVLAYVLVIMSVVLIILVSVLQYVVSQINYGYSEGSREESFQIAEAGVNYFRWYLAHKVDGKTTQQIKDFWQTGNPIGVSSPYEAQYFDPNGAAIGKYRLEVSFPSTNSTIVTVKATGWTYRDPDIKRVLQVRLRRPSWSEYTVLSNSSVRFGSGTDVQGKLFSNGGIHFDGVAHNVVYSGVSTYYDSDSDVHAWKNGVWTSWANEYNTEMKSNVFLAGKSFPISSKDFSGVAGDLNYMKTEAKKGGVNNGCSATGCYFDNSNNGREIIINPDGTFKIRTVKSFNGSTNAIINYSGNWATYNIPNDGVIFVEENVWLSGTINNKRVTIVAANLTSASAANVYISNDIRYTNYDGRDVLGIIGQNDVEIIYDSEDDLKIDGALLAQEGRVGRAEYHKYGITDHKTTITVYGAIASNDRFGFAWTDGSGYQYRNLYYDNNLLYNPPPYFPTSSQYLMDLWEEL